MESLIQSILSQVCDPPTTQFIIRQVPHFVAYANTLVIPGSEKRATVLRGLHELIEALKQAGKVSAELQTELDQYIDLSVPPMIDAILDVASGRVEVKMPTSVAEVTTKGNCLLGFLKKQFHFVIHVKKVVKVKEVKEAKEEVKEAKEEVKEVVVDTCVVLTEPAETI